MNIQPGTGPTAEKYTDYDLIKSEHPLLYAGAGSYPVFPAEYDTDAKLTMPNQNAEGQPNGCTNYTQADLATDLTGVIHNPDDLEEVTHANEKGGFQIRDSLDIARKVLGWFGAFFNIKAYYPLDYFDAFRLAQTSGLPEKRSISLGTPWFPSWENAILGNIVTKNADGSYTTVSGGPKAVLLPMPLPEELAAIKANWHSYGWHNSKLSGWKSIDGKLVYRDKSWQGPNIGDGGFVYFDRATINTIMALNGTMAYTATSAKPSAVQRIDLPFLTYWMSYIKTWMGFTY